MPGSTPGGDLDVVVARLLAAVSGDRRALVAIDGVGASGKTTFAAQVRRRVVGRPVIVVHVDDFFQPSAVRHARGRLSPEGFWLDAYNYDALVAWTLLPLQAAGDGLYRSASFDPASDRVVEPSARRAPTDALVLVEGTFLHRDELVGFWDYSIFLDVPPEEAARRMAARDGVGAERATRYRLAQELYVDSAAPRDRARLVVDNGDVRAPRVVDD